MELLPLRTDGSIDRVIETYKSTVFGIALTRTQNRSDADDIFQEVFLTYYRKQPSFNEEEHRKAWLIKTAINCSKKFLNKKPHNTVALAEEMPSEPISFQSEDDALVYTTLCELPEKYRMVLYLYYFEELPVEKISQMLKMRPGTVRMQMTRGRELMREKLKGEFL